MVTGATGFFGSHLCRRLRETGAEIYAVSRTAREDAGAGFRWLQADLNDTSAVRRMLLEVRPDVVFHLSGIATADVGLELVLPTFHALLVDRWLPKIRGNFSLTPCIPPQLLRARFETGRGCSGMRQPGRTEGEQDLAKVNRRLRKALVAQA